MENALKDAREKKGWTQYDLARKSGVNQGHISRIEGGQRSPSLEAAERLAAALEMDAVALVLAIGLDAIMDKAAAGELSPNGVAEKSAQLIDLAADKPGLLTDDDKARLVNVARQAFKVAQNAATKAAGDHYDMLAALGRNADGTSPRVRQLGLYHLDERDYGGAQGTNPEERHLGRTYGGAEVRRGPVADGEPGPARRGAGTDALGRGVGGTAHNKRYGG